MTKEEINKAIKEEESYIRKKIFKTIACLQEMMASLPLGLERNTIDESLGSLSSIANYMKQISYANGKIEVLRLLLKEKEEATK